MITESEISLEAGVSVSISAGGTHPASCLITVTALLSKGSRPVDVEIRTGQLDWVEHGFVELRFDRKRGSLRPVLPVVYFGGAGAMVLLLGLSRWLCVGALPGAVSARIDLNRAPGEDAGFYRSQFLETKQGLVGIYESGIVALTHTGELRWHVRKSWGDEFVEERSGELVFMREEQHSFAIDLETGEAREL